MNELCTWCDHGMDRHRNRRCIDCDCYGFTTSDLDASIARHPAGKGLNDDEF